MSYKKLLQQSIDLHVHVGPEIIPRKFGLAELLGYEKEKLKGVCVKNHFFPTMPMNTKETLKQKNPFALNSIVLNHYAGGFNSDIVRASAESSPSSIVVWFPTIHAENILRKQKFEIPLEWIDPELKKQIALRRSEDIDGLSVFSKTGEIKKEVKDVLSTIKECGAILATGHISWQESQAIVKFAIREIGLKKVIVTHPIYQDIAMPLKVQKELAEAGAFIEHCFSMHSIDRIPIKEISNQIDYLGAGRCILSSDVGQTFSKSPSEALSEFLSLLEKEGFAERELKAMLVDNPSFLVT